MQTYIFIPAILNTKTDWFIAFDAINRMQESGYQVRVAYSNNYKVSPFQFPDNVFAIKGNFNTEQEAVDRLVKTIDFEKGRIVFLTKNSFLSSDFEKEIFGKDYFGFTAVEANHWLPFTKFSFDGYSVATNCWGFVYYEKINGKVLDGDLVKNLGKKYEKVTIKNMLCFAKGSVE